MSNYYVSDRFGSDSNDGLSLENAFKTLSMGISGRVAGDYVLVDDGVYGPISDTRRVDYTISAINGPSACCIDGGASATCCYFAECSNATQGKPTLIGFEIKNGGKLGERQGGGIGGTIKNCIIHDCSSMPTDTLAEGGAGWRKGIMYDCDIYNNIGDCTNGGGTMGVTASGCTVHGNSAIRVRTSAQGGEGGGMYSGSALNCKIYDNYALVGGGGTRSGIFINCEIYGNSCSSYGGGGMYIPASAYNCYIHDNFSNSTAGGVIRGKLINCTVVNNRGYGVGGYGANMQSSATDGMWNCIVYGNTCITPSTALNELKAYGGSLVYNCYIPSSYDVSAAVVSGCISGIDPKFVNRYYDHHLTSGSPLTERGVKSYNTQPCDYDGKTFRSIPAIGCFETPITGTIKYVNATATGLNNGSSWENAYTNLQTAVQNAANGTTIIVADGTYGPISRTSTSTLLIKSVNGYKNCIINGGGTDRCAMFASTASPPASSNWGITADGFTFINGNGIFSGIVGGTVKNSVFSGCSSNANSFGIARSSKVENCLFTQNYNIYTGDTLGQDGKYVDNIVAHCDAYNTSVIKNYSGIYTGGSLSSRGAAFGGASAHCYNCIAAGNNPSAAFVSNNTVQFSPSGHYYNCVGYQTSAFGGNSSGCSAADPGLQDFANDNFNLTSGSVCRFNGVMYDNTTGCDLNYRKWNSNPSIGCFESSAFTAYIDNKASGNRSGLTRENAFNTIREGLNSIGENGHAIVCDGIYTDFGGLDFYQRVYDGNTQIGVCYVSAEHDHGVTIKTKLKDTAVRCLSTFTDTTVRYSSVYMYGFDFAGDGTNLNLSNMGQFNGGGMFRCKAEDYVNSYAVFRNNKLENCIVQDCKSTANAVFFGGSLINSNVFHCSGANSLIRYNSIGNCIFSGNSGTFDTAGANKQAYNNIIPVDVSTIHTPSATYCSGNIITGSVDLDENLVPTLNSVCYNGGSTYFSIISPYDFDGNARKSGTIDIGAKENQYSNIIYVDVNATGTGDGSSWTNAFTQLNTAINSSKCSANSIVLVKPGIYNPLSRNSNIHYTISAVSGLGSTIVDASATTRAARFYAHSMTVTSLSADIKQTAQPFVYDMVFRNGFLGDSGAGVYGGRFINCVISGCTSHCDTSSYTYGGGAIYAELIGSEVCSCCNKMSGSYEGTTATSEMHAEAGGVHGCYMSGCHVHHCSSEGYGGGMRSGVCFDCEFDHCYSKAHAGFAHTSRLYGCDIHHCSGQNSYGGINASYASGCTIHDNIAMNGEGGGVGGWHTTIGSGCVDCEIYNCSSNIGGGIYAGNHYYCDIHDNYAPNNQGGGSRSANLTGCKIHHNHAATYAGGTNGGINVDCDIYENDTSAKWGFGGGTIYTTCTNCRIYNNLSYSYGGVRDSNLYNCLISGNSASGDNGGGICCNTSYNIEDCQIVDNWCSGGGGGVYTTSKVQRCIISGNSAMTGYGCAGYGSNLYSCLIVNNYGASTNGCAMLHGNLINCTVIGNHGKCFRPGYYTYNNNGLLIANNIIMGNYLDGGTGGYYPGIRLDILMSDTRVLNNVVDLASFGTLSGGVASGNIETKDPGFVDMYNGNYHLKSNSVAIGNGKASAYYSYVSADADGDAYLANRSCGCYEIKPYGIGNEMLPNRTYPIGPISIGNGYLIDEYVSSGLELHVDGEFNFNKYTHVPYLSAAWYDLSHNGYVLNGKTGQSTNTSFRWGKQCWNADLSYNYFECPSQITNLFKTVNYTIEFVLESTGTTNQRNVFIGNYNSSGLNFERDADGYLRFYNNESPDKHFIAGHKINKNEKCDILLTVTTTGVKYYYNGVLSDSYTGAIAYPTLSQWINYRLGRDSRQGNIQFEGNYYNLKMYNRILTDAEIKKNFNINNARFGIT